MIYVVFTLTVVLALILALALLWLRELSRRYRKMHWYLKMLPEKPVKGYFRLKERLAEVEAETQYLRQLADEQYADESEKIKRELMKQYEGE